MSVQQLKRLKFYGKSGYRALKITDVSALVGKNFGEFLQEEFYLFFAKNCTIIMKN